jgi:hypothetical protein
MILKLKRQLLLLLQPKLFVILSPSISLLFLVKLCLREYWIQAPSAINSKTLPEYLDELAEAPLALKMLAPKSTSSLNAVLKF